MPFHPDHHDDHRRDAKRAANLALGIAVARAAQEMLAEGEDPRAICTDPNARFCVAERCASLAERATLTDAAVLAADGHGYVAVIKSARP